VNTEEFVSDGRPLFSTPHPQPRIRQRIAAMRAAKAAKQWPRYRLNKSALERVMIQIGPTSNDYVYTVHSAIPELA